ncbi:hypothetical protein DAA51_38620 [Bradyrhizobium sp. WBAH10]|nr:hypothetical protein [Bradyrhizobium sp. WBAH30]MDD1547670.1 hypothetical protein [Bradyrhizobium sp. WBAH41]MDD1561322.1 hypothetical protein [Bradyrhizobium sp. WBAH23]NRB92260.1 hypothetical protein [Bradyrhizobium sp. WBAH10]QCJ93645.1 hypothetical protein DAA57_38740 [Bradyrhizobium yuanmingense]QCK01050.1 hypothetical protein DAA61_38725 [Bradyrhizobium sp. WBAH33]
MPLQFQCAVEDIEIWSLNFAASPNAAMAPSAGKNTRSNLVAHTFVNVLEHMLRPVQIKLIFRMRQG